MQYEKFKDEVLYEYEDGDKTLYKKNETKMLSKKEKPLTTRKSKVSKKSR